MLEAHPRARPASPGMRPGAGGGQWGRPAGGVGVPPAAAGGAGPAGARGRLRVCPGPGGGASGRDAGCVRGWRWVDQGGRPRHPRAPGSPRARDWPPPSLTTIPPGRGPAVATVLPSPDTRHLSSAHPAPRGPRTAPPPPVLPSQDGAGPGCAGSGALPGGGAGPLRPPQRVRADPEQQRQRQGEAAPLGGTGRGGAGRPLGAGGGRAPPAVRGEDGGSRAGDPGARGAGAWDRRGGATGWHIRGETRGTHPLETGDAPTRG